MRDIKYSRKPEEIIDTLHIGYMVIGYKVKSATWSIFGWSHLLLDIL